VGDFTSKNKKKSLLLNFCFEAKKNKRYHIMQEVLSLVTCNDVFANYVDVTLAKKTCIRIYRLLELKNSFR